MDALHIARRLLEARRDRATLALLSAEDPGLSTEQAYDIAAEILALRRTHGEQPIGRKIGFTNRNIWPEYGVYQPIWAHVYDTTVRQLEGNRGELSLDAFVSPRIEPEIVLHFCSPSPVTNDPLRILACIDWIAHGYEIVDSPFVDWRFAVADTIAAFGLHGALLIGSSHAVNTSPEWVERLASFSVSLACDGAVRDRGAGSNVLDSPLAAAAHLIALLATQPRFAPIEAGEIVTTGTLTAALPVHAGETWSTTFNGLDVPGLAVRFV